MWIFAALVIIPVIEIALFIELGGWLGLWPTIGLIIATAILGAALLRAQGFAALRDMQARMAEGGDPSRPLANGLMIVVAGLLMLTPGFLTDMVGFLLLMPPVRAAIIAWAGPRIAARAVHVRAQRTARRGPPGDEPINVDYVDLDQPSPGRRPSGWSKPPN